MGLDQVRMADSSVVGPRPEQAPRRFIRGEKFIRGPIPLGWITAAGTLPGRALHVGLAIWYLAGLAQNATVVLAPVRLREFGVDRHAGYRALRALEEARLVNVAHRRGASPVVTIIERTSAGPSG